MEPVVGRERRERSTFDALEHGLWARFTDGDRINHGAWLRVRAEGGFVGTCRRCGDYLVPLAPYEHTDDRVDYEAHCRREIVATMVGGKRQVEGCEWTLSAPGGRMLRRSSRHDEMPTGWWENRLKGLAKPMEGGNA